MVDISSISGIDEAVIGVGDPLLGLVAEEGVLKGVNISGVSTTP